MEIKPNDVQNTLRLRARKSTKVKELGSLQKRNGVLDLISKGYTQIEVAKELNLSQPTVSRIWNEANNNALNTSLDYKNKIVEHGTKRIVNYQRITRTLWDIVDNKDAATEDRLSAIDRLLRRDLDRVFDDGIAKQHGVRSKQWPNLGLDVR